MNADCGRTSIFPQRADNLVCAVLVLEDVVVVKTVMHHFTLED